MSDDVTWDDNKKNYKKDNVVDESFEIPWEEYERNMKFINGFLENCEGKLPPGMRIELEISQFPPRQCIVWNVYEYKGGYFNSQKTQGWAFPVSINQYHSRFVEEWKKAFNRVWNQANTKNSKEGTPKTSISLKTERKYFKDEMFTSTRDMKVEDYYQPIAPYD